MYENEFKIILSKISMEIWMYLQLDIKKLIWN